jgi:hypothetical protein
MNCLVPAILFAIISTVAVSLANGVNLLTSFLAVLAVLASLECGYVGGVVAAYFAARMRLPHRAERIKFWKRPTLHFCSQCDPSTGITDATAAPLSRASG